MPARGPLTERAANEAMEARIVAADLVAYIDRALEDGEFCLDEARETVRLARLTSQEVEEAHFWSEEAHHAVQAGMAVMRGAAVLPSKNTKPVLRDANLQVICDVPIAIRDDADDSNTAA